MITKMIDNIDSLREFEMKIVQLTTLTVLALVSSISFAGAALKIQVEIDEVDKYAHGSQWAARTARNDVEKIGCGVTGVADGQGGGFGIGFCQATDADELTVVCQTEDEYLLDVIKAVGAYSYIRFSWDDDGLCTMIKTSSQSWYLPPRPRR